ncbi:sigma-54-dependent Fis family transcriptional regulator [Thermodesulfatator atlanticus]|uniref:sigma-54-dependent Fis family transcriptional regulator n=1 Tax=Thermodesulfatator atlanticus TaxID=501497 RepID=UPI0003B4A2F2|nr:sigma-54-dependent Fis family transcriptional regulator [Thermodesulfatator atlanticus]
MGKEKSIDSIKLQVLHEACRIIGHAFDLDEALRKVLFLLAERLKMQRASVALFDEELGKLVIKASYGLTRDEEKRGIYAPGEGVTGKVFVTGEPCIILDVRKEPLFLNRTGARKFEKEQISFLAVPIELEGHIIGVLTADRLFGPDIDFREDIRFLEIIALLIAQFVKLRILLEEREQSLRQENLILRTELKKRFSDFMAASRNPAMQKVLALVRRVAPTKATVLLLGESGTGKTLTARLIHELSPRAEKPFVKINCAVLPENLLEAELFGYEKGAFTGAVSSKPGRLEEADGGTVFLDEIAELSLSLQAKLLRFIQEREFERLGSTKTKRVDVRIIAATNKDLLRLVREGKFREDLYFRLNVFPINIPPLRDRKEDIPLLINFIMNRLSKEYARKLTLSPEVISFLVEYNWPGNIRELENFLERLFIICDEGKVSLKDIQSLLRVRESQATQKEQKIPTKEPSAEEILDTLKRHNFIVARAAKELGLTFRQLRYRIKKLGLEKDIPLKRGRPSVAL